MPTPKQRLAEHLRELHPAHWAQLPKQATLKQMQTWHRDQHHRFPCSHHHGPTAGPDDRPIGWRTGENAVLRAKPSL